MAAPRFVHLRLHTEYSIVDGMARVDDAVERAAADGMPALAISDASNLFGAIKFFQAARERGVQPIIGVDLWVTNERNRDAPHRITLLCRNRAGYLALCALLTRAHAENHTGACQCLSGLPANDLLCDLSRGYGLPRREDPRSA